MEYQITPCDPEFEERFRLKIPQLISRTLIADLETPVLAMLKLKKEDEPCFLLESVQGGETRGRYSIIGIKPDLLWRCKGNHAEINLKGTLEESDFHAVSEASLISLKSLLRQTRLDIPAHLPPMAAGLIGYVGYDMVRLMENLPDNNPDTIGLPDSCLMRPRVMIIFDSVKGIMQIITPIWADNASLDAKSAHQQAVILIEEVVAELARPLPPIKMPVEPYPPVTFIANTTREAYHATVNKAKAYIAAGDIFQVLPSMRFKAPFNLPHFSLYRSLRHINPSPFLFFLNFGAYSLVGSSPEILVRLRDGVVTIRPLAGTRKRGATPTEDKALEEELLSDEKERAEHLMLLDLGRNDIGRVAKSGTVKVTDKMKIEHYSHVMHIVSNVEGEIDPVYDAVDALIAGFPAGTVSGAPKIRAMEIIDELENERRSFYSGCVGYFSAGGSMDTCITLRTALVKDGAVYAQAGGGVVMDSDPESEYQEACNKAEAVMKAAREAYNFV